MSPGCPLVGIASLKRNQTIRSNTWCESTSARNVESANVRFCLAEFGEYPWSQSEHSAIVVTIPITSSHSHPGPGFCLRRVVGWHVTAPADDHRSVHPGVPRRGGWTAPGGP